MRLYLCSIYACVTCCVYRFFQLMGSVFSFVSSDLKQKIDILTNLLKKNDQQYTTVKSMIEYEKENKQLEKPDLSNGTRTLLRLHRGLGTMLLSLVLLKNPSLLTHISIF